MAPAAAENAWGHDESDPVWAAMLASPLAADPPEGDELAAIEEAVVELHADLAAGRRGYTPEEIRALIEDMRRAAAG